MTTIHENGLTEAVKGNEMKGQAEQDNQKRKKKKKECGEVKKEWMEIGTEQEMKRRSTIDESKREKRKSGRVSDGEAEKLKATMLQVSHSRQASISLDQPDRSEHSTTSKSKYHRSSRLQNDGRDEEPQAADPHLKLPLPLDWPRAETPT
ncbi:hypothetical protein PDE_00784 [Penicillium oxalicum 114-2]|uniref:Uncharacterized protein n=1 Tax=Penicillium oxalicum (strain 114-2 / CGMCC 5302) TaxID=933388 RepID=S8AJC7_PENO1|nr:hypothetical protein PDE_00784 [Penicillium oxalicum 114-2]